MVKIDNDNNEEYEDLTDELTDTTEPDIESIEEAEAGKPHFH